MNVGMLMVLIIYMFAIVGVEYFAEIKLNAPMTRLNNFQTLPKALLTLFTVATSDGWNTLLLALQMERSAGNDCVESPSYEDYVKNNFKTIGCGSSFAQIYMFSFSFLISIVFMNLFIAIILQGYFSQVNNDENSGKKLIIERFRDSWASFDPKASA
jgi:hypothetical protein